MRFSPVALLLAAALFFGSAFEDYVTAVPRTATSPHGVRIELWQDADSARYVVSWRPSPVGKRQKPIDFYQTRIVTWAAAPAPEGFLEVQVETTGDDPDPDGYMVVVDGIAVTAIPRNGRVRIPVPIQVADTLAAGQTSGTTDTLAVAYPPIDSSLTLRALVRAVDTDGDVSPWMMSLVFTLTTRKLPPSPPDSVQAVEDTLGAIAELHVRPSVVELVATDSAYADSTDFLQLVAENRAVLFCAFAVRHDGTTGITHPGSTGHEARQAGDIALADYISDRCWALYERWKLERSV